MLSAKRISRQALIPFGIVGSVLRALLDRRGRVHPAPLSTYATRYGVIGAVFATISALICVMVVVVGSSVVGREVHDELDRIRRGEKAADDGSAASGTRFAAQARSRWDMLRQQLRERRRRRDPD